jgi:hypothetical protein
MKTQAHIGWEACRRQVFSLAEHTTEALAGSTSDFERGRVFEAKSIAKAMNAFGPEDCAELRASLPPADPGAVALPAGWTLDHINKNYILQKPGEGGGVFSLEDSSARVAITAAFLRDLIAAPSVPSASLTTPSKEPAGAVAECQHAKDVGMWPEHRCVGKCYYADLSNGEDAPEYLVHKARAALNVDADQEISLSVVAWITDSPEEGSVNIHQYSSFSSHPEAPAASVPAAEVAQPVGYEHFAAIREGHRNAAEDAWFQAIPNMEPRRAFQAGFDAGYNTRDAALASSPSSAPAESGWQWVPKTLDENMLFAVQEGADILPARAHRIWKMLLAAAPQAVQAGGEGGNG